MLRRILFVLSRSRRAAHLAATVPGIRGFSHRFVAGETQADVIDVVRRLNAAGLEATVSYLGEAVTTEAEVADAVEEFTSFADAVAAEGLRSHVSIKLTELGLDFDRDLAARSLDHVLDHAALAATFVRIDMEDSRYTDVTLSMFRTARERHANVGVVIQAALHRSAADIDQLAREAAPVRLVKGAYREPPEVALQDKRDVDANFGRLADLYMRALPADGKARPGGAPGGSAMLAIATHDTKMIAAALRGARSHALEHDRLEFQMLYGIRTDLQRTLLERGHRVRVYVPYGSYWYPYLMRRMAERPANLWFFLRHAFR